MVSKGAAPDRSERSTAPAVGRCRRQHGAATLSVMDERYWDPRLETLPVERRRLLQDHRLRWQGPRCWDGSPFYRARLEAAGINPATFNGLRDLGKIPILRPGDLPGGGVDGPSRDWTVAPEAW